MWPLYDDNLNELLDKQTNKQKRICSYTFDHDLTGLLTQAATVHPQQAGEVPQKKSQIVASSTNPCIC